MLGAEVLGVTVKREEEEEEKQKKMNARVSSKHFHPAYFSPSPVQTVLTAPGWKAQRKIVERAVGCINHRYLRLGGQRGEGKKNWRFWEILSSWRRQQAATHAHTTAHKGTQRKDRDWCFIGHS
ncbi:hypothetical protein E2C01_040428 [Portunus trituberculatus]|uniref:Uncharacterized protein n=1 Tax=Portunus trituberculatus TaxID=210409 RepID=A0A5B7FNR7_PORTR|nr:hypothetical protein [Portunus trituberculatus]